MISICRVAVMVFGLLLAVSAEERKQPSPGEDTFDGVVEVSTSAGGFWTYVTVTPQPGAPLSTAFTVQYQNRMPPVAYQGTGRVALSDKSLAVRLADKGVLFKFPSYEGGVPARQKALDIIGIASHSWAKAGSRAVPLSHEEFVASQVILLGEGDPPLCDYRECICGGREAQSCSCQGVSVSCYAPYEACCVPPDRAFCCKPNNETERIRKSIKP